MEVVTNSRVLRLIAYTVGIVGASVAALIVQLYRSEHQRGIVLDKLKDLMPKKFILGHSYLFTVSRRDAIPLLLNMGKKAYEQKIRFSPFWLGPFPMLDIWDPEFVRTVIATSSHMKKNTLLYLPLRSWLGDGLLLADGTKWRSRRHLITPAFHFEVLNGFTDIMQEQAEVFVEVLREKSADGKPFDIFESITLCALDIIGETAMGCSLNAQRGGEDNEYVKAVYAMSRHIISRVERPWNQNDTIFSLTAAGRQMQRDLKTLHDFTTKVIETRRAIAAQTEQENSSGKKRRRAFLDLLLTATDEHTGKPLTRQDIQEEVDTFLFEGHDTTAASLVWTVWALGRHPEVQRRAQEEVDAMYDQLEPGTRPSMDAINRLKYLECVLKESLRLYPSVPVIGRELTEDIEVDGLVLPKGLCVTIPIMALNRNPDHWPNPEVFDPDRWSNESAQQRHPYSYIPFSAGPRNCIGQKFAQLEERVLMAALLRNFDITSHQENPDFKPEVILRPHDGIIVTLKERKHARA